MASSETTTAREVIDLDDPAFGVAAVCDPVLDGAFPFITMPSPGTAARFVLRDTVTAMDCAGSTAPSADAAGRPVERPAERPTGTPALFDMPIAIARPSDKLAHARLLAGHATTYALAWCLTERLEQAEATGTPVWCTHKATAATAGESDAPRLLELVGVTFVRGTRGVPLRDIGTASLDVFEDLSTISSTETSGVTKPPPIRIVAPLVPNGMGLLQTMGQCAPKDKKAAPEKPRTIVTDCAVGCLVLRVRAPGVTGTKSITWIPDGHGRTAPDSALGVWAAGSAGMHYTFGPELTLYRRTSDVRAHAREWFMDCQQSLFDAMEDALGKTHREYKGIARNTLLGIRKSVVSMTATMVYAITHLSAIAVGAMETTDVAVPEGEDGDSATDTSVAEVVVELPSTEE